MNAPQNIDNIIEKAQKILALAKNGVGGEKTAAQKQLNKIIKKYGLNLDDLQENRAIYKITIVAKTQNEKLIAIFTAKFATQKSDLMGYKVNKHTITFTCLTKDECAQIAIYSDSILPVYLQSKNNMAKRHKKERDHLVCAFISKNNLIRPDTHLKKDNKSRTSLDIFTIADIDKDIEEVDTTPQLPFISINK